MILKLFCSLLDKLHWLLSRFGLFGNGHRLVSSVWNNGMSTLQQLLVTCFFFYCLIFTSTFLVYKKTNTEKQFDLREHGLQNIIWKQDRENRCCDHRRSVIGSEWLSSCISLHISSQPTSVLRGTRTALWHKQSKWKARLFPCLVVSSN